MVTAVVVPQEGLIIQMVILLHQEAVLLIQDRKIQEELTRRVIVPGVHPEVMLLLQGGVHPEVTPALTQGLAEAAIVPDQVIVPAVDQVVLPTGLQALQAEVQGVHTEVPDQVALQEVQPDQVGVVPEVGK
jgi:hypothetical protein